MFSKLAYLPCVYYVAMQLWTLPGSSTGQFGSLTEKDLSCHAQVHGEIALTTDMGLATAAVNSDGAVAIDFGSDGIAGAQYSILLNLAASPSLGLFDDMLKIKLPGTLDASVFWMVGGRTDGGGWDWGKMDPFHPRNDH